MDQIAVAALFCFGAADDDVSEGKDGRSYITLMPLSHHRQ